MNREDNKEVSESSWFQFASLSKTVGSAFAMEYFKDNFPFDTPVNQVLEQIESPFR